MKKKAASVARVVHVASEAPRVIRFSQTVVLDEQFVVWMVQIAASEAPRVGRVDYNATLEAAGVVRVVENVASDVPSVIRVY